VSQIDIGRGSLYSPPLLATLRIRPIEGVYERTQELSRTFERTPFARLGESRASRTELGVDSDREGFEVID